MIFFKRLVELHDKLLMRDLARTRPWMIVLLLMAGLLGLCVGILSDHSLGKCLTAVSGFAVGVAIEKFAQTQVRRIERKFKMKS